MTVEELLLSLLRSSLWGTPAELQGQQLSHEQFLELTKLSTEQAVMGLVSQGLMDSGVRLEREDALNLFVLQQHIRRQNKVLDDAVISLCREMSERDIHFFVFKGQPLARNYPDAGLRQSGDIDFFCYPDDWKKAELRFKDELKLPINDLYTEKDIEFRRDGVAYEMHKKLTLFANPKHSRYWEKVVMPEILAHPYWESIDGNDVPTLAPTYNVLYVFIHIFQHLISDGVGLRQFCDWAVLLAQQVKSEELIVNNYSIDVLEGHLEGIGMKEAFTGLGAILTDYLGLPEEQFPFPISEKEREEAKALLNNIYEMGNFGHNRPYHSKPGVMHGIKHLGRIYQQSRKFSHYAPSEVRWKIPYMFKWWGMKILRILKGRIEK